MRVSNINEPHDLAIMTAARVLQTFVRLQLGIPRAARQLAAKSPLMRRTAPYSFQ